jgi:cytoskeletal protein RodZ
MPPPKILPKEEKPMTPPDVEQKLLRQRIKQLKLPKFKLEHLLMGGAILVAIGLAIAQSEVVPPNNSELTPDQLCQEIVQPKAVVTREQLAKILTIPERTQRAKVQAIVQQPYCKMPSVNIRAGATTEREASPLAEDRQTWLVVAYEGGTYVGYGFKRF